ncbi:MAG: Uma2 family endonuclease [Myxococcota bacterium]
MFPVAVVPIHPIGLRVARSGVGAFRDSSIVQRLVVSRLARSEVRFRAFVRDDEIPGFAHELVVSWLIQVVGAWLGGRGFIVGSEAKIVVSPTRGRKPDAIVFLPGSKPPPPRGALLEPPDIVVEVVTPDAS